MSIPYVCDMLYTQSFVFRRLHTYYVLAVTCDVFAVRTVRTAGHARYVSAGGGTNRRRRGARRQQHQRRQSTAFKLRTRRGQPANHTRRPSVGDQQQSGKLRVLTSPCLPSTPPPPYPNFTVDLLKQWLF